MTTKRIRLAKKSTYASRLQRARRSLGLGARELARRAKLSEGHVWVLEHRDGAGSAQTTEKLAKALGVEASWLMFGTGTDPVVLRRIEEAAREKRSPVAKAAPASRGYVARKAKP